MIKNDKIRVIASVLAALRDIDDNGKLPDDCNTPLELVKDYATGGIDENLIKEVMSMTPNEIFDSILKK